MCVKETEFELEKETVTKRFTETERERDIE